MTPEPTVTMPRALAERLLNGAAEFTRYLYDDINDFDGADELADDIDTACALLGKKPLRIHPQTLLAQPQGQSPEERAQELERAIREHRDAFSGGIEMRKIGDTNEKLWSHLRDG